MTNDMEWKIAKWLHKHGTTKRSNIPAWFPMDLTGKYRYFHVLQNPDKDGYLVVTDTDEFVMLDGDLDAFKWSETSAFISLGIGLCQPPQLLPS